MRVVSLLSLLVLELSLAPQVPAVSPASIGRRQLSIEPVASVPSSCTSACSSVNDEINLGCPLTACCTTTFETQYYDCLECVGTALDSTSYTTAQNSLNLLYTTCVDLGFVLPPLALPGQTASGSNSSTSAYPASTGAPPSAAPSSPTGSSGATGAATRGRRRGLQAEAWIGAALFLWLAGPW